MVVEVLRARRARPTVETTAAERAEEVGERP
jgi:hypothetical protein